MKNFLRLMAVPVLGISMLCVAAPAEAAQTCGPTVEYLKMCTDDNVSWYPVIDGLVIVADNGPKIDGAFVVGNTLRSIPTQYQVHDQRTVAPPGERFGWYQAPFGVTPEYRWVRDDQDIPGADLPTYVLTPADEGKHITLYVKGSKPGTLTSDLRSETSGPVMPRGSVLPVAPAPADLIVSGDARVGSFVFATSNDFDIDNNASRQWLRDGVPIPGATHYGYAPTLADLGARLSLRVRTYKFGFNSGSKTSSESAPVAAGTLGTFVDVHKGDQFATEMQWMFDQSISTGWDDHTYRPAQSVNRDAMVAFMHRLARKPYVDGATKTFPDVADANQFYKEISWAATIGITGGYADGTFRPTMPVNRDAMAAFMYRLAGSPEYTPPTSSRFTDVRPDNQFYKEISWMYDTEISKGWPDGTYRALEPVQRDAMAAFLYRFNTKNP